QAAPPLVHYLAQATLPPGATVVLGCGRGHDALLFARAGFTVTGVDYAPSAIAAATDNAHHQGLTAQFLQRDIFALLPEYAAQFDYVVEHTCFCALEPALRDRYVTLVHQLLKPQGTFIGLFFTHDRPGGPPYGTTPGEITTRFAPYFAIETLTPTPHSVAARRHEEHLGIMHKRSQPLA
ncbi:MAG TPA: methyltransferase domain-containing protein, partial [Candidatus Obscuribacterales bacterium]